ncbi:unnamed protein product [Leptidea sinapis]|uniref:Uncharacterized protein n=1 Tax=Leptidea sinapis TaxID=189913 RepID=A0A5E4R0C8_9NEOP|nr:unnamed protein product [Leptidea sinapis]
MNISPESENGDSIDCDHENADTLRKRKRGKPTTQLPSKKRRTAGAKHMPVFYVPHIKCDKDTELPSVDR